MSRIVPRGNRRNRRIIAAAAAGLTLAGVALPAAAVASPSGNVIFMHPDGMSAAHWTAARQYWAGPDGKLQWDLLPAQAQYRGHMKDEVISSSNAAATTHAFGFKFERAGSFGKDGDREAARTVNSLSGHPGSILRQAQSRRSPIGVVNDGMLAEPGTGAFLAEVGNRDNAEEISLQMINGRPGANDADPQVLLGAGERWFLPAPTPEQAADPAAKTNGYHGWGSRQDGRDLIAEARERGYEIIRTRTELQALRRKLTSGTCASWPFQTRCAPKVLGLFARNDIFNDRPEEVLVRGGHRIPGADPASKETDLLLFGSAVGAPYVADSIGSDPNGQILPGTTGANDQTVIANGQNPPTFAEMNELALLILDRESKRTRRPFALVSEPESTDNLANNMNAIGTLVAAKRADDALAVARRYRARNPHTLIMTAADGDASGMEIMNAPRQADGSAGNVGSVNVNPTGTSSENVVVPTDGRFGRGTQAFLTEPDQFGKRLPFQVLWVGPDATGGMVVRAEGPGSELLTSRALSERFDNIDIYRVMAKTLFGSVPAYPEGQQAPTR